jgi:hypothetical protein
MGRVTRIALALALVAGTAAAQPAAPRATPPGPGDDGTHHREGEYGGVSPDGRPSPDAKRVVPPAATLGWIGYRPGDAGAELFLMAAQPFSVEQRLEDGQVVLTLVGVRKLGRNLRRPLDTRFFDGPLARVAAKVVKARRARRGQPRGRRRCRDPGRLQARRADRRGHGAHRDREGRAVLPLPRLRRRQPGCGQPVAAVTPPRGRAPGSRRSARAPRRGSAPADRCRRGRPRPSSIQAAICRISASPMPRLVTAGVPKRMPDGSKGLRGSKGTVL